MSQRKKRDIFTRFTTVVAAQLGRAWVFVAALIILIIWAASGPFTGYSDTWQLLINTGTTIITFLMVFIIQNTQNRDNLALNLKLNALLKKQGVSEKDLLEAEEESEQELQRQKDKQNGKKKRKRA